MVTPAQILDALADGLVAYDVSYRCTYANEAAISRMGRDPRGRDVREVLDGLDAHVLATVESRYLRGASLTKGGPTSDISIVPIEGGTLVHCRALESSSQHEDRERLEVTLEAIGDGVIVTDAEGRVTRMNVLAEEHTGWTRDEARGRPVSEILRLQDELQKSVREPVREVLDKRQATALHDHTLLVARSGDLYPVAYSAAPIVMRDERLIGAILVFRDMRGRRRLEEELLRGAKLSAVGDLAGYIAHDFNNVLGAILGATSLAQRLVAREDRVTSLLGVTEAACRRGQELAQELLTFARGGAPLKEAVEIAPIARRAAEIALKHPGTKIDWTIAPDLAKVRGDAGQLRQAIQNLLRNAEEASAPGSVVEVCIGNTHLPRGTSTPVAEGDFVEILVKDQGEGIPDDRLSSIFDPFYTTRPRAVGLGLATVHSIVYAHSGFLTVESTAGEGTTFKIWLPAASSEKASTFAPTTPASSEVLVMDDDPLVRSMLISLLEELGYAVTATSSGDEAVFAFVEARRISRPFALVILDLTVPGGKGGVQALREMAVMDPSVRAIVTSGYSEDPVLANYREHGFSGVLALRPEDAAAAPRARDRRIPRRRPHPRGLRRAQRAEIEGSRGPEIQGAVGLRWYRGWYRSAFTPPGIVKWVTRP